MTWMTIDRPLPAYAWLMARIGLAGPLMVPAPPRREDAEGAVLAASWPAERPAWERLTR